MSKVDYAKMQKQLDAARDRLSKCVVEHEDINRQLDDLEYEQDEVNQQIALLEDKFYDLERERDDLEDEIEKLSSSRAIC